MILVGDALTHLRSFPDACVQCCVTSPPYWMQRLYCDGQIGLEPTPSEFVAKLVGVFREVRRVLRDDGVAWVNLGDTYVSGKGKTAGVRPSFRRDRAEVAGPAHVAVEGLEPKQLVGIPWRVAFALQDDGWWLRSDIVWERPNAMPEGVTDRPSRNHEYIFLLAKSARYFYDVDAVRERQLTADERHEGASRYREGHPSKGGIKSRSLHPLGSNVRSVWRVAICPSKTVRFSTFPEELARRCVLASSRVGDVVLDPFMGSGTTCAVASAHQRDYVGIELNPETAMEARERIDRDGAPLFDRTAAQ